MLCRSSLTKLNDALQEIACLLEKTANSLLYDYSMNRYYADTFQAAKNG